MTLDEQRRRDDINRFLSLLTDEDVEFLAAGGDLFELWDRLRERRARVRQELAFCQGVLAMREQDARREKAS